MRANFSTNASRRSSEKWVKMGCCTRSFAFFSVHEKINFSVKKAFSGEKKSFFREKRVVGRGSFVAASSFASIPAFEPGIFPALA